MVQKFILVPEKKFLKLKEQADLGEGKLFPQVESDNFIEIEDKETPDSNTSVQTDMIPSVDNFENSQIVPEKENVNCVESDKSDSSVGLHTQNSTSDISVIQPISELNPVLFPGEEVTFNQTGGQQGKKKRRLEPPPGLPVTKKRRIINWKSF